MRDRQQQLANRRWLIAASATAIGLLLTILAATVLPWFSAQHQGSGSDDWAGSIGHADLRSWVRSVGALGPDLTHWFGFGWLLVAICLLVLLGVALLRSPRVRLMGLAVVVVLAVIGVIVNIRMAVVAPLVIGLAAVGCWLPEIARWIGTMVSIAAAAAHIALMIAAGAQTAIGALFPLLAFAAFALAAIALPDAYPTRRPKHEA